MDLNIGYSLIRVLFIFVVPAGAFFLTLSYLSRRKFRLTKQRNLVLPSTIQIMVRMLPILICWSIANRAADHFWDKLHNDLAMPVRSLDSLIIFNLAATGLFAVMLAATVGLVELYDRYRKAPQA